MSDDSAAEPGTPPAELETRAWLLGGALAGNVEGVLRLAGRRLNFTGPSGQVFDAPLDDVRDVTFPWYYFNGGLKLRIGMKRYRVSFVEPVRGDGDLSALFGLGGVAEGRRAGRLWRQILGAVSTGGSGPA
jgi:hypothetical protein